MGKKSAKERQQGVVKKGGAEGAVPALPSTGNVTMLTLEDGTEVPVGRPAGIDDAQYAKVLEHLRNNPDIAKQQAEKAQVLLQNSPMMVNAMMAQQRMMATPGMGPGFMALKDDPELKEMFDDIKANGPEALSKYWDDMDMMSKISKKMEEMKLQVEAHEEKTAPADAKQPVKAVTVETIHDAAKVGDVQVLLKFIDSDKASVDKKDARGITPLGVAVGFNRVEAVKALLAAGADANLADAKGNSPLHYACGYGRKEAAEALLASGAKADLKNDDGQTPLAVAQLNQETGMEKFMREKAGAAVGDSNDPYL